MPFKNNNVAAGLDEFNKFEVGDSDVDLGNTVEQDLLIPWPSDPVASWIYYDCNVSVMLDSGIVVHRQLPQVDSVADSLASCFLEDPRLDQITGPGVNIKSSGHYADTVQRMAHSCYWFRIWGQAIRVGAKVPIPGIKTIGGVPAIPFDRNPQFAFNRIFPGGNYNGVILWHAGWSLWYTTAIPPRDDTCPAADAAAHINAGSRGPGIEGMQPPFSQQDDDAVPSAPNSSRIPPPPIGIA